MSLDLQSEPVAGKIFLLYLEALNGNMIYKDIAAETKKEGGTALW